jgi:hypothetical protein
MDSMEVWSAELRYDLKFTIPYGHFVTHHYFVIFNYRPQIYTTHLATSLNTFNIFHILFQVKRSNFIKK